MTTESAKIQKQSEKLISEFQTLRNQQRACVNNLNTLEMELKEHKTVIDTLKTVNSERKCFRLIGGVLCERQVKDVLPQLIENRDNLEKSVIIAAELLTKKGIEINKFKEEHNIKIKGQESMAAAAKIESEKSDDNTANRNILVVNN